jgi:uracil-DNA glycosylase family 4
VKDNLGKIIEQTENYLKSLNRFYGDALYLDKSLETLSRAGKNPEQGAGSADMKKENTPLVEVDLFGNVIARREEWEFSNSIDELNSRICECQKCVLGKTRTKFVFGVGDPHADIVMIGEAPGADEDAQGEPFVGRAGQLLNKIIEAIDLKREEVYICNILKCRPPGNRNPMPDEIEKCEPYLNKQLELINPKLILILGKVAADTLLNLRQPLNKMRGKVHYYNGIRTMVTFHPAALLRNPHWKRPTWEDMQQFKKIYEEIKDKQI